MEQGELDYLYNEEEIEEEITETENNKTVGLCFKCRNTNYILKERNGILGVVYTATDADSSGKLIKKLKVCNHGLKVSY